MINVIIPMYNSSKYIKRCIDSVISQTYRDWNMTIVDDGSKDDSLRIAQIYAQADARITVYHQENKGAGAARNFAINLLSDGEYTVFVDSDDYIEADYFELLSEHNEDVVFIDAIRRDVDTNKEYVEALSKYSNLSKDRFIRSQMTGKILWGGVRKAVKTSIIKTNGIRYSNQKVGEEALYSFDVLYHSKSFGFINQPVYRYEVRNDSLSHTPMDDPWGPVVIELRKRLQNMMLYEQFSDTINAFLYSAAAVSLVRIAKNYSGREYYIKARKRIDTLNKELDRNNQCDKESLSIKVKIFIPLIKVRCLFLIKVLGVIK